MSWLTNFVRPKIRALVGKADMPDNLWIKCPSCEQMLFHRELAANLQVCNHCGHHMRMGAAARLAMLLDDDSEERIALPVTQHDPLRFRDTKRYSDRLRDAQAKTGEPEAALVARGTIGGHSVVVAALDFAFMGGSMGIAVGEALLAAAEAAVADRSAFVAVTSSGGARMQEGILSLIQMPRSVIAVEQVREAGLPYIVVLTDPTTGGVTASFAMVGDVHVAEPGATVGFAGRRVIQDTIREELPDGFQRAETMLEHGMIDMVVPRTCLREVLARLIGLLMAPHPPTTVVTLSAAGRGAGHRAGADA
ncbi:MAG: acetyl-CoA carboxylase carboxyltransferase subunit beta [Alphaproteobacteria bacterium]|nr:acetyl-CoA carboxylase carboxyltransferase subunit beta [Alphaproteobacteria bacterium]